MSLVKKKIKSPDNIARKIFGDFVDISNMIESKLSKGPATYIVCGSKMADEMADEIEKLKNEI